jgi:hypothetical protein
MNTSNAKIVRPGAVKLAAALLVVVSGITMIDLAARSHSQQHVVTYAGTVVLELLFAWAFLQGKGWVRWAFLAPVSVGFLASPRYFSHASTFSAFYFCLVGLLQVGVLVLVFLKPSNDWFRERRKAG